MLVPAPEERFSVGFFPFPQPRLLYLAESDSPFRGFSDHPSQAVLPDG